MINEINELDEKKIKVLLLEEESEIDISDFCKSTLDYVTFLTERNLYSKSKELKIWADYFTPIINKFINILRANDVLFPEQGEELLEKSKELSKCLDSVYRRSPFSVIFLPSSRKGNVHYFLDKQWEFLSEITLLSTKLKSAISNRRTDNERFFEFYDFYNPDISNKEVTIDLLREAIQLIQQDESLNEKAKQKIISKIIEIINNLENPNTKWTVVLGSIKESIIILGALGSLAGGCVGLAQAADKLKDAEEIVCSSSINNNFYIEQTSINTVFELTPKLENKGNKDEGLDVIDIQE